MLFVFRADASLEIGAGHVVRCAALAKGLVDRQHSVLFLCRNSEDNLIDWLESQGFKVCRIAASAPLDEQQELYEAGRIQGRLGWLIVDHYDLALDWERKMRPVAERILVIDDLGRSHDCDLLLDQNYGSPLHAQYRESVPPGCDLLLGSQFALLRPEFRLLRDKSISRSRTNLRRLLVFLSGSDPTDETSKVLEGLRRADLNIAVDIVVGAGNPHVQSVQKAAQRLSQATVHVQTDQMAQLMVEADCCIGAAGSASWERCALGLPALVTSLSKDQIAIAEALHASGAHRFLGPKEWVTADHYAASLCSLSGEDLVAMSMSAASICDGSGVDRVVNRLTVTLS